MLIPISWLKEFVDLTLPTAELGDRLTQAGLEVEGIHQQGDWWDQETIVVAQVVSLAPHPEAERLLVVEVDLGNGNRERVVSGAPHLFQYLGKELPTLKVPFARVGAELVDATAKPKGRRTLQPVEIRGVSSNGMICSERELGLSDQEELLFLPEETLTGTPLRECLGDEIIDVALTPDMARCLSILGVAREVACLTDSALRLPAEFQQTQVNEDSNSVAVNIDDARLCARYTAQIIRDVQVGPAPFWMQLRLREAGLKPISNIVDITNYVMLELGQPLHAFDYDKLVQRAKLAGQSSPEISIRSARAGEKLVTLDETERELEDATLVIADALGPIALAGIMGGNDTAISSETKNILLESASFDGINVRRTSQRLKLHTDASTRFTRGVPSGLNSIASLRATSLIEQLAGGRRDGGITDEFPAPKSPVIVYLTETTLRRQLGIAIALDAAANVLRKLDFEVEVVTDASLPADRSDKPTMGLSVVPGESVLRCVAPWYRLDVQYPADLIEEVARIIGYDRIETTLLSDALPEQKRNVLVETEDKIRQILVGCGLQETINYSLTTPEQHARLRLSDSEAAFVTLANPLSSHRRVMRRSLLVSAVENLVYNSAFTNRLMTFEIGRVYLPELGDGVRPFEDLRLSLLLTGSRGPLSVHSESSESEDFDFFDLKGLSETLAKRLALTSVEFFPLKNDPTFTLNSAEIQLDGKTLGRMGELHPNVLSAFGLPTARRVLVAELELRPLVRPSWKLAVMAPISNYPPVVEDLAFIVAEEIPAQQVEDAIKAGGGDLLVQAVLFDVYRGDPLPAQQKSLAYKLTYQSFQSTLNDEAVTTLRNQIVERVKNDVGGVLRSATV
jgi:phenylalanyl-tRNA synthetase beta chain